MTDIPTLDAADLARLLGTEPRPVLVDFWADWCGPCQAIAPAFAALAKERGEEVAFVKVDADRNPALLRQLGITSASTFDRLAPSRPDALAWLIRSWSLRSGPPAWPRTRNETGTGVRAQAGRHNPPIAPTVVTPMTSPSRRSYFVRARDRTVSWRRSSRSCTALDLRPRRPPANWPVAGLAIADVGPRTPPSMPCCARMRLPSSRVPKPAAWPYRGSSRPSSTPPWLAAGPSTASCGFAARLAAMTRSSPSAANAVASAPPAARGAWRRARRIWSTGSCPACRCASSS